MNRIAELRDAAGMKQVDLALKLKVSQGTLSNWEREVHDPDTESLIKLSEIFNVSTDYIIGASDEPYNITGDDDELMELREHLRRRPEMKVLFDLTKTATKEQVEAMAELIDKWKT